MILVNRLEDLACPVKVWLGKLTAFDMTPLGWLCRKTSTQTNLHIVIANCVDPDQTAPSGAVWSGSAQFAYVILLETLMYEILKHLPYPQHVFMWNKKIIKMHGLKSALSRASSR